MARGAPDPPEKDLLQSNDVTMKKFGCQNFEMVARKIYCAI